MTQSRRILFVTPPTPVTDFRKSRSAWATPGHDVRPAGARAAEFTKSATRVAVAASGEIGGS